jgi:hypothetical protein
MISGKIKIWKNLISARSVLLTKTRKIKMNYKYYLHISYLAGLDYGTIQDEIESVLGCSGGSGYGFGCRDLIWYFNNIRSLKSAVRKARALPRRIKCKAWEILNEDYDEKEISLRNIR